MIKIIFKMIKWPAIIAVLLCLSAWYYPEKYLTVDSGPATADALIVLGGGGPQHERVARAVQLYKLRAAPRVILTGAGDDEINRQLLEASGVPARAIEVENKSTTTRENAIFTGRLLSAEKIHTAILVTSWYHARRAEKTFEHFAPQVRFFSRPSYFGFDRTDWPKDGLNKHIHLEFLKLPGYWACYGVNPF